MSATAGAIGRRTGRKAGAVPQEGEMKYKVTATHKWSGRKVVRVFDSACAVQWFAGGFGDWWRVTVRKIEVAQ